MNPGAPFSPTMLAACGEVAAQFATAPRRERMRRSETVVRAQIAGVGGEMHFTQRLRANFHKNGAVRQFHGCSGRCLSCQVSRHVATVSGE